MILRSNCVSMMSPRNAIIIFGLQECDSINRDFFQTHSERNLNKWQNAYNRRECSFTSRAVSPCKDVHWRTIHAVRDPNATEPFRTRKEATLAHPRTYRQPLAPEEGLLLSRAKARHKRKPRVAFIPLRSFEVAIFRRAACALFDRGFLISPLF